MLFQKYSLYWSYAALIFTSKLHDPAQQYNPPTKRKISDPPPLAKTFLKLLTLPHPTPHPLTPKLEGGGACPDYAEIQL